MLSHSERKERYQLLRNLREGFGRLSFDQYIEYLDLIEIARNVNAMPENSWFITREGTDDPDDLMGKTLVNRMDSLADRASYCSDEYWTRNFGMK